MVDPALLPAGYRVEVNSDGVEVVYNARGDPFPLDGVHFRLLKNGAVLSVDTGRIVAITSPTITTQNSNEIRLKWFERKLQAALAAGSGMAYAVGTDSELAAWSMLAGNMARLANGEGRVAVEAFRALGSAAGFVQAGGNGDPGGDPGVNRLELTDTAVAGIVRLLGAIRGLEGE